MPISPRSALEHFGLISDADQQGDDDNTPDDTDEQQSSDENSDNAPQETPDEDTDSGAQEQQEEETQQTLDDDGGQTDIGDDQSEQLQEGEGDAPPDMQRPQSLGSDPEGRYHIYTRAFDEILPAEDLADLHELTRLRATLDKHLQNQVGLVSRLANRLQRKLMARQQRSWQFDLEEGYLDSSKLTQIITGDNVARAFKREKENDFRDTIVTLLIDNSGSMRGRPIAVAALCADILDPDT